MGVVTGLLSRAVAADDPLFLVREGMPQGAISVVAGAGTASEFAAAELAGHVEKMTGGRLAIRKVATDREGTVPGVVLVQEGGADDALAASGEADAFAIEQRDGVVTIRGRTDIAVLYGAYDYLHRLGIRWFMPGELGEHVPSRRDIPVEPGSWTGRPSFRSRVIDYSGSETDHLDPAAVAEQHRDYDLWLLRNKLQFLRPIHHTRHHVGDFGFCREQTQHDLSRLALKGADLATEPERFALIGPPTAADARRMRSVVRTIRRKQVDQSCQPCLVHPENIRATAAEVERFFERHPSILTVSISPEDNGLFCDCDGCVAANGGVPPSKDPSLVFWKFANAVARIVRERFPEKRLSFYGVYVRMHEPPAGFEAEPTLQGVACHVQENNRDLLDPSAAANATFVKAMRGVVAARAELASRDYTLYAGTPQPLAILRSLKPYHDLGSVHYHCESMGRDEQRIIVGWIQAQLLWDVDQDPGRLLEEFCRGSYGAAGDAVLRVLNRLDDNCLRAPSIALGHNAAVRVFMTEDRIDFNNPLFTKSPPPYREATGRASLVDEGRALLRDARAKVSGRELARLTRFSDTFEMWCRHAEVNAAYARAVADRTEDARRDARQAIDDFLAFWQERNLDATCSPRIIRHRIIAGYRDELDRLAVRPRE